MTIFDEISIIANKLANEGKTPSVALIKSQLKQPVPLPQIITTLKSWQHDPTFIQSQFQEISNKGRIKDQVSNNELDKKIAEAIAPLQQEMAALQRQMTKLLENQKIKG